MNFRLTPVLAHSSNVTSKGSLPWGGKGKILKSAENGCGVTVVVVVVVVVVTAGSVTPGGSVIALVVVVVSLPLRATAVPATAAPPATIPSTAPEDRPPAPTTKPGMMLGAPGVAPTTTVDLVRNGATGTSRLHSDARTTTIGLYSAVRPSPPPLLMPST